ncbi:acyl-CoA dehydrogenase family protein [Actinomadura rupiterrae]|uniref:acyl-CoA dehydrogenase family protein n=1 Tax=Actinomadura rupiterrae TaxID=559627 RepID=UPI0020A2C8C4|nr:acyl-CoA dehydrogenase family protein [Actinomadura rupiterrae]MCP2335823.1 acyl-CoA dehydrogenase [Actinomadura rupiterrae]
MRLIPTEEQRELAATVRSFLADRVPMSRVREIAESDEPFDRTAWTRLSGELGLTGLAVPEEHGGSGAGFGEVAAVLEELGAALTPVPYFSAVVAADLLAALDAKDLLPDVASGATIAILARPEGEPPVGRIIDRGEWVLEGAVERVPDAVSADLLLVVASTGEGRRGVFAVAADAPGLVRTPLTTLDLTRPQARIELGGAPARLLGPSDASDAIDRSLDVASVLLAAEQLGGLRRCLDAIVEYAKLRVQFGRYVGSFQGVKHKLADMHCTLEQAESVVRYAVWAVDEAPDELPEAAALAASFMGRAYFQVAKDHLLLYGGIGFTWEHDAHLYYKRAKADEVMLGAPRTHRARLAAALDLPD